MRAVREGVAEAPVPGIEDVREALRARRRIRGDHRGDGPFGAGRRDHEFLDPANGSGLHVDRVDPGERRLPAAKFFREGVERLRVALEKNTDALGVVEDLAGKIERRGNAPDGGTKAHALDEPFDAHEPRFSCHHPLSL